MAVLYALVIGFFVYRNITLKDLYTMLCAMTRSSGIAFIVLSTAGIFIWLLTTEQIPQQIAEFVLSVTTNKYLVLLIINLILLFVGCFMDSIPALIILGPVFTPLAMKIGVHPLHFGTIMCLNLTIGLATPPLGACLFTCCAVGRVSLEGSHQGDHTLYPGTDYCCFYCYLHTCNQLDHPQTSGIYVNDPQKPKRDV